MISLFSSETYSASPMARRLAWYGLLLVGTMVALWAVTQTVAMPSSDSKSPSQTDSTAVASSVSAPDTEEIEVFTWGNVTAFLLLVGGGGAALYLRQQQDGVRSSTPFRRLGKLSLGPSKHMQLVACGGEVLLLSVTEDEITLLKTYPQDAFEANGIEMGDGAPSAAGEPPAPTPNAWSGSFADALNRFADRSHS